VQTTGTTGVAPGVAVVYNLSQAVGAACSSGVMVYDCDTTPPIAPTRKFFLQKQGLSAVVQHQAVVARPMAAVPGRAAATKLLAATARALPAGLRQPFGVKALLRCHRLRLHKTPAPPQMGANIGPWSFRPTSTTANGSCC